MKIDVKKFMFRLRFFCGAFLILFSGFLTLPIYVSIRDHITVLIFPLIVICIMALATGHWWIKRAYDNKDKTNVKR